MAKDSSEIKLQTETSNSTTTPNKSSLVHQFTTWYKKLSKSKKAWFYLWIFIPLFVVCLVIGLVSSNMVYYDSKFDNVNNVVQTVTVNNYGDLFKIQPDLNLKTNQTTNQFATLNANKLAMLLAKNNQEQHYKQGLTKQAWLHYLSNNDYVFYLEIQTAYNNAFNPSNVNYLQLLIPNNNVNLTSLEQSQANSSNNLTSYGIYNPNYDLKKQQYDSNSISSPITDNAFYALNLQFLTSFDTCKLVVAQPQFSNNQYPNIQIVFDNLEY